jgi:chemotaxis protein CheD
MGSICVDVASYHFKKNGSDLVRAASLGSSICTGIYDPAVKTGGLYIFVFPDSSQATSVDPDKYPLLYADTGLMKFFSEARNEYKIDLEHAKIAVCGGAHFLDAFGGGQLGKKNCEAACQFFEKIGIKPGLIQIGGLENYSLEINLKTGELQVEVCSGEVKTL